MRTREKFIIWAVLLSLGLWLLQLVPIHYRYWTIGLFSLGTYFACALLLRHTITWRHWLLFLPVCAIYSLVFGAFNFLLPGNLWSLIFLLAVFALGMYALLLMGNIFTISSQGRTIQLARAAHNILIYMSLVMSLLGVQTIFSFDFPYYLNFLAVLALHYPLILAINWSVNLDEKITMELTSLTFFSTLILAETALILSFLSLENWHIALLIMSIFYLDTGILQVFLNKQLQYRSQAVGEYTLLALFIVVLFVSFFPTK